MRRTGPSSELKRFSPIVAAISDATEQTSVASLTTSTLPVLSTDAKMVSQSIGETVRGSMISADTPATCNRVAASCARDTIRPVATMVRSEPSRATAALPNGTSRSGSSDTGPLVPYKSLGSKKITGSSPRNADFKSPLASAGVEGMATRNPGICANQASSD